jgi:outer membrane protein OmpA-like peptidoglycan-associated protein
MKLRILLTFLSAALIHLGLSAQPEKFLVEKASFSSEKFDEFSPSWFKNGLVFCSNRKNNPFLDFSDSRDRGMIKMFYVDTIPGIEWTKYEEFAKEIQTKLNNGPVTFNSLGDTIYYSRNRIVEGDVKKLSVYRNKLGLFSAVFNGQEWTRVREFRFNSEWYNITAPCLSPDGRRLYFASDRPDGYGGADIYYCKMRNGYWEEPVNLGPEVNTSGNEAYPFINEVGELFFSSDGHPGYGGRDIFVTKEESPNIWYTPVLLDAPVNSEYDDFGMITDNLMTGGYFSSNRDATLDIFKFRTAKEEIWFSEPQKENQYCFTITDTGSIYIDTLNLKYEWVFEDNSKLYGTTVNHCFPGSGNYKAVLNIIDRETGDLFFHKCTYNIEVVDYDQPFISSEDNALVNQVLDFDGLKSYCPGYSIENYFWDFGDNTLSSGERMNHMYNRSGEYDVKLELTLKSLKTGRYSKRAVSKKILVFDNERERSNYFRGQPDTEQQYIDIASHKNARVSSDYNAEAIYGQPAVFRVEILTSPTRISPDNAIFSNLPSHYPVKEIFSEEDNMYRYSVFEQPNLTATYLTWKEIKSLGYPNSCIRLYLLKDPVEVELFYLKERYGVLSELYFDVDNRLLTNAYLMFNKVAKLMTDYPELNLEVAVYTDDLGSAEYNLRMSQTRAQLLVDYLISAGMERDRLIAKGYGETQPVASNARERGRRLNRRIEIFTYR